MNFIIGGIIGAIALGMTLGTHVTGTLDWIVLGVGFVIGGLFLGSIGGSK